MNTQQPSSPRGIALILVMVMIIVLGILAGGFAYSMKVETTLARTASTDSEMEWMGRSGLELASWVLAQSGMGPQGQFDALNQKWAGGPGDTNGALAEVDLSNVSLGRGTISVKIADHDRKFNINMADETILRQALMLVGVDASRFPTIVDSILDWRDPDDDTHLAGTETDFYERRVPPYVAKNGPIDDMGELLFINGITPAMFYGASGGRRGPADIMERRSDRSAFEEPIYATGLQELFTAVSSQRVNINTTTATVLQLIPEIDENVAASIISGPAGRAGPDGADGTEDDMPFRSIQEVIRVPGMNPQAVQLLSRFFTTRSSVFEATVTASIGGRTRTFVGVLRRGRRPQDVKLLYTYWKEQGSAAREENPFR